MTDRRRIAVLGGGAWGTALAQVAARNAREVLLWARDPDCVAAINGGHGNPRYLPGIDLHPGLRATSRLDQAAQWADVVLLAVPAQALRATVTALRACAISPRPLVICAKGIELDSGLLPTELLAALWPEAPVAVLSGPTFAGEVARGLPTAVTLASENRVLAVELAELLGSSSFRPYVSDDPVGAEVGGALKNVVAIACGVTDGYGLGENARAALITRGLAEIARLAAARGGRAETVRGLSGLGDLALSCTSATSRNYALGAALGRGQSLPESLSAGRGVVEGVATAAAARTLGERLGVDLPVTRSVDAVVNAGAALDEEIAGLLARPFRDEGS